MRLFLLTALVLGIFASNSLLCRTALIACDMGPLFYTAVRSLAAAAMLAVLCLSGRIGGRGGEPQACDQAAGPLGAGKCEQADREQGAWRARGSLWQTVWAESSWPGALFLFGYMFFFSLAFVRISSAAGTLVLNVAVQLGMVGFGLWQGVRLGKQQMTGFAVAFGGLVLLVSSQLTVPSPWHALLMALSGLSWAGYTLVGRRVQNAALATAGNFLRCAPLGALTLLAALVLEQTPALPGVACALAAGAVASSLGYILWYDIQPRYDLISCAIIQLAIPVITALLAVPLLAEPITLRLVLCSALILGGIALAIVAGKKS